MMRAALLVAAKELRIAFRDRQTVLYTIVLPLAMYPVLFWVMLQAATLVEGRRESADFRVAIAGPEMAESRLEALAEDLGLVSEAAEASTEGRLIRLDLPPAPIEGPGGLEALLADGADPRADVALWVPADTQPLEVRYDSARARSENALTRLERELEQIAERKRGQAVEALALPPTALSPIDFRQVNLSSASEIGAFVVSMMLPMMIILMAVMGAFYPAVDFTAGERERKTEETTLLAPVPRLAVQAGKLLAVTTASGIASAVNLLGMGLAAGYLLGMLGGDKIGFELNWIDVALVAPFALPLIVFVSAVLTAVASLAETFKQGQSLLGPTQMLFIFPAVASSLPGIELTPGIACTPIVGAAVTFRTILRGGPLAEMPWGAFALSAAALLVYAAIAVWFSVRLLDRELSTDAESSVTARFRAALARR